MSTDCRAVWKCIQTGFAAALGKSWLKHTTFELHFTFKKHSKHGQNIQNAAFIRDAIGVKVGLSPTKNCFTCFNESPLKFMTIAFYFRLKAFSFQDI